MTTETTSIAPPASKYQIEKAGTGEMWDFGGDLFRTKQISKIKLDGTRFEFYELDNNHLLVAVLNGKDNCGESYLLENRLAYIEKMDRSDFVTLTNDFIGSSTYKTPLIYRNGAWEITNPLPKNGYRVTKFQSSRRDPSIGRGIIGVPKPLPIWQCSRCKNANSFKKKKDGLVHCLRCKLEHCRFDEQCDNCKDAGTVPAKGDIAPLKPQETEQLLRRPSD